MADELLIPAGWAVWSKPAGTREDYSVLACSGTFSKADFGTIITRFAAGTPDTRVTQGPAALPWVTVSWVGVDDGLNLGIAVTDNTGQVDGVGRPITRTSYCCLPYDQLKSSAVSYTALYRAVEQAPHFPDDGQPLSLAVPRLTDKDLWGAVERREIGEQAVGSAAALLLNGPVTVVQAEGSTLDDRLLFIDAVASLLPYGLRARFAAATWSDSGVRHRLRLAFAARPREDAAVVAWRHGGDVPAGDSAGRRYFDQFMQLRGRRGPGTVFAIHTMVSAMARETEAQRFEQPDAVQILRGVDLPQRVLRQVRDRVPYDLAELRLVLTSGRLTELESGRAVLLEALSEKAEPEDWPTLTRWLDEAREDPEALGRILVKAGRRMLWAAEPAEDLVRECLRLAAEDGIEDGVLAGLLQLPAPPPARYDASVQMAAAQLARAVFTDGTGRERHPLTRERLTNSPVAAAEMMAALARSGRGADLLRWLGPQSPPPLVRLFEFALEGRRGKAAEEDIAQLARLGDDCVSAVLRAASETGRLGSVLPACTSWLAARGDLSEDARRYWGKHLRDLVPGDPQLRAYLDTALLTAGASPTALPPPAGHPDFPGYAVQLAAIWKKLTSTHAAFSGERCVRALADYLNGQHWMVSEQQATAVADLAARLAGYDAEHILTGTVASALAATPAAEHWDYPQKWLAWARRHDPAFVQEGLLASLASQRAGTDPGQLAGLCLRACREGIEPDAAYYQLAQSGAVDSAEMAIGMLACLRREFDQAGVEPKMTAQWEQRLARMLARGDFAQDLRERMVWKMSQHFQLLAIFVTEGHDGQYELTDDERDELGKISGALESLVKKSRKRSAVSSLWRPVWGSPGDDQAPAEPWSQDKEGKETR
jgi:hypothetical protein